MSKNCESLFPELLQETGDYKKLVTNLKAPLPFMGQKRAFVKKVPKVLFYLQNLGLINKNTVFIDLFGGSGLLAHLAKLFFPLNEVIYNDYDNYTSRLKLYPHTKALLERLLSYFTERNYHRKAINKYQDICEPAEVEFIKACLRETGENLDCITVSTWLLYSLNYEKSLEGFLARKKFYNRLPLSLASVEGYLSGVTTVREDFKDLLAKFKDVKNKFICLDPPYIQTYQAAYENTFRLKDLLYLLKEVEPPFVLFGNDNSDVLALVDFFKDKFKNTILKKAGDTKTNKGDFALFSY